MAPRLLGPWRSKPFVTRRCARSASPGQTRTEFNCTTSLSRPAPISSRSDFLVGDSKVMPDQASPIPSFQQMELRSRKIAADQATNDSPGPVGATPTKRTSSSGGSPSKASKQEASAPSAAPAQGLARTGKLLFFTMGIWVCFINWGIVQQRITSFEYENQETKKMDRWKHMVVANSKSFPLLQWTE